MADVRKTPIGIELIKRGVVTKEAVQKAIEYQKEHPEKKLGDIINILNLCSQKDLIEAMGEILNEKVILLRLDSINVNVKDFASIEVIKQNKAIPFDVMGGKVKVCFADTANKKAIDQMRLLMLNKGLVMDKYLTFESNIDNIIEALAGKKEENLGTISDVTGLIDTIIRAAMDKRASDIHIEPMEDSVRIRYRIDGELITVANLDKKKQTQIINRLKAISNMHQEKQEPQDGRILLYDNYNIRVSSQKNVNGEKFVLRLLEKDKTIKGIFELGFPEDEKLLKKCFDKRNSITIIAAPTGEGKTTTLYSIIDYLNKPEINITTIEDPVEIRIPGLNQIEIDSKTSFADSLRTVLRQDPNIVLVGEIRDLETAEIAMQSGQTGHYVLSTIHTIDSIEVITRLRKMGISDYDIASTMANAISQRLIRKPCPSCSKKREFTEEEKEIINKLMKKYDMEFNFNGKYTYDIAGCKECNYTGFLGRIAAFEILNISEEIKEMLIKGESTIKIKDVAIKEGYRPLFVDAMQKVVNGIITLDEVNRKLVLY